MKTIKKQIELVVSILIALIFCQGCAIYHNGAVSLGEAMNSDKPIKIQTKDGRNFLFKEIILEEDNYYGLKKSRRKFDSIQLITEDIKTIKLKNKTMSTVINIGVPIVVIGIAHLIDSNNRGPVKIKINK